MNLTEENCVSAQNYLSAPHAELGRRVADVNTLTACDAVYDCEN